MSSKYCHGGWVRRDLWFTFTVMTALAQMTRFDVCAEWCLPA